LRRRGSWYASARAMSAGTVADMLVEMPSNPGGAGGPSAPRPHSPIAALRHERRVSEALHHYSTLVRRATAVHHGDRRLELATLVTIMLLGHWIVKAQEADIRQMREWRRAWF